MKLETINYKIPVFSVVIPTFNRENVIMRAVQSVIEQTVQDFEIIVIDDGSNDNTKSVISTIPDFRIRYFFQENRGASKARNKGIEMARGKYIAFLDSDDKFLPHHLDNARPVLERGENICTYTQIIVDRGRGRGVSYFKPPRAIRQGENIAEYCLSDRGFVPTSTLIVPTSLAKQTKYDENLSAGDDIDFAIRITKIGAKLSMLKKPGAICYDIDFDDRLSRRDNIEERLAWLERLRPTITKRAFYGDIGWRIAKKYSERGEIIRALRLYLISNKKRCYSIRLSISVFLQIILPAHIYRKLSDNLARIGVRP